MLEKIKNEIELKEIFIKKYSEKIQLPENNIVRDLMTGRLHAEEDNLKFLKSLINEK